jgi:hypothetical protein
MRHGDPRPFIDTEDPRVVFDRAESGLRVAGSVVINPWRSADVGAEFCVPQGINYATRNADYYRRKYDLEFSCRKSDAGAGTIVRRVR